MKGRQQRLFIIKACGMWNIHAFSLTELVLFQVNKCLILIFEQKVTFVVKTHFCDFSYFILLLIDIPQFVYLRIVLPYWT